MELQEAYSLYQDLRNEDYAAKKAAIAAFQQTEKKTKRMTNDDFKKYGYDVDAWNTKRKNMQKQLDQAGYVVSTDGFYFSVESKDQYYSRVYGDSYVQANKEAAKNKAEREAARAREAAKTPEQKAQEKLDEQRKRDEARLKRQKETKDREDNIKKDAASRLKKYQEARDKANADEKVKQEKYQQERKERLAKEAEARHKVRTEGVENAKKQAETDAASYRKSAEEAIKNHSNTNTANETSKQALDDMKSTVKDIWNATTGGITAEWKNSLAGKDEGSLGYAKTSLNALFGGLGITNGSSALAALQGGLTQKQIATLTQNSMLNLQKDLTTGMMTQQIVLDAIANQIQAQGDMFNQIGHSVTSAYLIQRAYINAYLKETFGNPTFMKEVHGVVTEKIDIFLDTLTAEKLKKLNDKADKKINNTFTRINNKVDTTTKKINLQLDKITKINILDGMNSLITKSTSMIGLINRMNKNPILKVFTPIVSATAQVASMSIMAKFYKPSFVAKMAKLQSKVIAIQAAVNKAKEYITQKTAQLKAYVNELKQKAMNAVTSYAQKIVNDIKSKITVSLAGAMGVKL